MPCEDGIFLHFIGTSAYFGKYNYDFLGNSTFYKSEKGAIIYEHNYNLGKYNYDFRE